jgi:hypothetical protein
VDRNLGDFNTIDDRHYPRRLTHRPRLIVQKRTQGLDFCLRSFLDDVLIATISLQ